MCLLLYSVFVFLCVCGYEKLSFILSHSEPPVRGLINFQEWSEKGYIIVSDLTVSFNGCLQDQCHDSEAICHSASGLQSNGGVGTMKFR